MPVKTIGGVSYSEVTVPPKANSIPDFFRELFELCAVTKEEFLTLSDEVEHGAIGYEQLKKWSMGPAPNKKTRKVIFKIFHEICSTKDIELAWVNKLNELVINKNDITSSKIGNRQNIDSATSTVENKLESDIATSKVGSKLNSMHALQCLLKKTPGIYIKCSLISLCMLISLLSVSLIKSKGNVNSEIADNGLVSVIKGKSLKIDENEGIDIEQSEGITQVVTKSSQNVPVLSDKSAGLLMDVYLLSDKYKELPSTPDGLKIASIPHVQGERFTFVDHVLDDAMFNAAADKDVGLFYHGYIELDEDGEHLFSMDYVSGNHLVNQLFKRCKAVLTIDDTVLIDQFFPVGLGQHSSRQVSAQLSRGLNDFQLWFTCNDLRSFNPKQDYRAFKDTVLTFYLRQPSEKKIAALESGKFFH